MKKLVPLSIVLIILCYGCKKGSESASNTIEFDINGQHYLYSVAMADFELDSFQGKFTKSVSIIAGSPIAGGVGIMLMENNSIDLSCFSKGDYNSYDINAIALPCGFANHCLYFNLLYYDVSGKSFSGHADTTKGNTDLLVLASCSGSPPIITGNFQARLYSADSAYKSMPVFTATNGKFSLTYNAP